MFQFDISQTEPMPGASTTLPLKVVNPFAMLHAVKAEPALSWLTENAKRDGVRVTNARRGLGHAGRIRPTPSGPAQRVVVRRGPKVVEADVPVRFETLVNAAYNPTEQLATLAHELAHLYCGHVGSQPGDWWPGRLKLVEEIDELEARSTAAVVLRRLLTDSPLPEEAKPDPNLPPTGRSLEIILKAAGHIIDMCQGFVPKRKPSAKVGG